MGDDCINGTFTFKENSADVFGMFKYNKIIIII